MEELLKNPSADISEDISHRTARAISKKKHVGIPAVTTEAIS